MEKFEKIFKTVQNGLLYFAVLGTFIFIVALCIRSNANAMGHRDYKYEQYCDSIWENNPEYYTDVLVETDEYQEYIKVNGEWWQ